MKKQVETMTIYKAIALAGQGNPQELEVLITALTKERDDLVQVANSRIAALNGQINLLNIVLDQATENKPE